MEISLRSQLAAGVAVLGVTAIAVTPLAAPDLTPSIQRVSAAVDLSAFTNPVTLLLETINLSLTDIFWQAEMPGPEDLFWPDSFYTEDFEFQYSPRYWGLGPDILNQFSNGALGAVLNNVSGYIDSSIYGTTALVGGVAASVFNIPFALIAAAQLALAGDIPAAIAELQAQILDPLLGGVNGAIQGFGWAIDNTIANARIILTETVPRLINDSIGFVLGSGTYLIENVIGTATAIVTNLVSLDIEGAWNAAVEGLLGYDGLLGSIEQLTVGVGIIQDVDYDGDVIATVVNPSVRSILTSNLQRLGDFSSYGDPPVFTGGIRNVSFVPAPTEAEQTAPAAAVSMATEVEAAEAAEVGEAAEAVEAGEAGEAVEVGEAAEAVEVGEAGEAVEVGAPRLTAGAESAAVTDAVTEGPSERESADDGTVAPAAEKPAKGNAVRAGGRGAR